MDAPQDHDLLIGMCKDVGYIRTAIEKQCKTIKDIDKRVDDLESWKDKVHILFAGFGLSIGSAWAKLMKMF